MDITVKGAEAVVADLDGMSAKALRGAVRAMNRAIVSSRAIMAREIAADLGVPVGSVKSALPISEANLSSVRAEFGAGLKRIPLIYFKARQTRAGVSYNLGQGRRTLPHAFIATMKSGHQGVFARHHTQIMRVQKPTWTIMRPAIKEKWGPSLGHVFKKYQEAGLRQVEAAFDTAFQHELDRILKGEGGGSAT